MSKLLNNNIVNKLLSNIKYYNSIYIVDISKISASDMNYVRYCCYKAKIKLKIAKNKLLKKSFELSNQNSSYIDTILKGSSALMLTNKHVNTPAKIIKNINSDKNIDIIVKGALIDSNIYVNNNIEYFLKFKTKEDIISNILWSLNSNLFNTINYLKCKNNQIMILLNFLKKRSI